MSLPEYAVLYREELPTHITPEMFDSAQERDSWAYAWSTGAEAHLRRQLNGMSNLPDTDDAAIFAAVMKG